jgi:hypothetical protein
MAMHENLVGYLLGSLDEATTRQVEAHLHSNPDARRQLVLLKHALSPLAADADAPAPPPGLAGRTLALIGEPVSANMPRAPREPAAPATRAWWRRVDVAVTATLLIFTVAAAAPLVYQLQRTHARMACQSNLRDFYVALATYRDQRGSYPDLTHESPRNVAGIVVPMLSDAGVLPATFSVRCPGVGNHLGCTVTLAGLRNMTDQEFQMQAPNLAMCYAFALGYRDDAGAYHAPWLLPADSLPILADSPPSDGIPSNSANHDGTGQNVLFLDGHFRFVTQRHVGNPDDDIFLNRDNRVAAGVDAQDNVLGRSATRP